jgi:hypothetical protein
MLSSMGFWAAPVLGDLDIRKKPYIDFQNSGGFLLGTSPDWEYLKVTGASHVARC